jgi:hypothetical protein
MFRNLRKVVVVETIRSSRSAAGDCEKVNYPVQNVVVYCLGSSRCIDRVIIVVAETIPLYNYVQRSVESISILFEKENNSVERFVSTSKCYRKGTIGEKRNSSH